MQDYHHTLGAEQRPKVLGLTASPAGKESVTSTKVMLHRLLHNLGDVQMLAVENEDDQLQKYCSTTKLIIKKIDLSEQEVDFTNALQKYMLLCYKRLFAETNINHFEEVKSLERYLDGENTEDVQRNLAMEMASSVLEVIDNVKPKTESKADIITSLKDHTKVIAESLVTLGELGLGCAYKELMANFSHAQELELRCDNIATMLENYSKLHAMNVENFGDIDVEELPIVKQLLSDILTEVTWEETPGHQRPIILVLVRRRKDVRNLQEILTKNELLSRKNIQTVSVMGHAAKTNEGMSIKQQDRAMSNIRDHKYQVIVATSIAEEGLDLPECELVVQMDPPNNVKSLVQIRGRARKKNSKFIALCRDQNQVNSLESLQEREGYMIEAVKQIIKEQSKTAAHQ